MTKIESAEQPPEIGANFFNAFKDANRLHSNFYEAGLSVDVVLDFADGIRQAVGRLLELISREEQEE